MHLDLRILFLFFLFLTGILFTLRRGPVLGFGEIREIFLSFLLVPTAAGTVLTFGFLLTRTDPMPLIRQGAYEMSLRQNISFTAAIPEEMQSSLSVDTVEKADTDGDGFSEWVVFYKFDLQSGNSPIKVIIYDSDRGNPPVIFPYNLTAPGRDYLAESLAQLRLAQVSQDQNGRLGEDLPEILISDRNQLSIFRFQENSESWDFPRDAPPRYAPIGFFRGNIGATAAATDIAVTIDDITKDVTVIDRQNFERSQLAVRSIYELNPVTGTYWDSLERLGSNQDEIPILAAPIVSTIDFFAGPPEDIFTTEFPEKIVLGFYTSICGEVDLTLCANVATANWQPSEFLVGDALDEYDNNNPGYFGLSNLTGNQDVSISHLQYYPQLEADPNLSRTVVTGQEPRFNLVDVSVVNGNSVETLRFEMQLIDGQWKIARRVAVLDTRALDSPVQINVSQ